MILRLKNGNLLVCFICILSFETIAQYKTGVVIDSLNIKGKKDGGCALYLPEEYNRSKKYGMVFFFDPAGQAVKPTDYYKSLANELDLIFIGLNNSRNGSLSVNFSAFLEGWKWSIPKFSVDLKRVYLAGFSGGARTASYITQKVDFKFAGVIGCGAGFYTEKIPEYPFRFVGAVGTMDMNYYEMQSLERRLLAAKWKNTVLIFEGGHVWSPKSVLRKALVNIQLSQMRTGELEKKNDFIQTNFNKAVNQLEELKDEWSIYVQLKEVMSFYRGLVDLSAVKKKYYELEKSHFIKEILLERKFCEDAYSQYVVEFSVALGNIRKARYNDEYKMKSKKWWERKIKEIEELNPNGNKETELVKKRLHNYLTIAPFEHGNRSLQEGDYLLALNYFNVCGWIDKESYEAEIKMAESYAQLGEKKNSLNHLKLAVKKGFNQKEILLKSTCFDVLRGDYGFTKLLSEISIPK